MTILIARPGLSMLLKQIGGMYQVYEKVNCAEDLEDILGDIIEFNSNAARRLRIIIIPIDHICSIEFGAVEVS